MSQTEFHYVRTAGEEGGVDVVDGRAIGVDLETMLKDGLPPFKVALEIIASLCEILDIADQDGEIHGDVHPRNIFVDDTGAVSVEGFGLPRNTALAPEGPTSDTAGDLYGLGYTAYRLLSTRDIGTLPSDPDGHDDGIIDAVIALPSGDMPEEWVGDIQWFLAKLMSFEPDQRPPAIDAWRSFVAFANDATGVNLIDWAPDAIEGGGERRDTASAVRPTPESEEEDLGGPVVKQAGIQKGAISFGPSGGKSGQATAFWSKDQMKAALEAETEDEADAEEAFKPKAAQATAFWTRDQMEAMAKGEQEAPRPKRKEGASTRAMPAPPPVTPPPMPPPPIAHAHTTPSEPAFGPSGPPPIIGGPVATPIPDPVAPKKGGKIGLMMALLIVVLLVLCSGAVAIGAGAYFFLTPTDVATVDATPPPAPPAPPEPKIDEPPEPATAAPAPVEPVKPATPPKDPVKSTSTTPAPSRTGTRTPTPSRTGTRTTAPPPEAGPTRVAFTVPGEGTMRCGDGSSSQMDGRGSITFRSLSADGETCSFISGGKPVCAGFVEPGNRKCTCDAATQLLTCQ